MAVSRVLATPELYNDQILRTIVSHIVRVPILISTWWVLPGSGVARHGIKLLLHNEFL